MIAKLQVTKKYKISVEILIILKAIVFLQITFYFQNEKR